MRSMVEGARAVEKILRLKRSVEASAPPTAQVRGPPSPLSRGGGPHFKRGYARLRRAMVRWEGRLP